MIIPERQEIGKSKRIIELANGKCLKSRFAIIDCVMRHCSASRESRSPIAFSKASCNKRSFLFWNIIAGLFLKSIYFYSVYTNLYQICTHSIQVMLWCVLQKKNDPHCLAAMAGKQKKDGSVESVESQQPAASNSWMSLVCFLALASWQALSVYL